MNLIEAVLIKVMERQALLKYYPVLLEIEVQDLLLCCSVHMYTHMQGSVLCSLDLVQWKMTERKLTEKGQACWLDHTDLCLLAMILELHPISVAAEPVDFVPSSRMEVILVHLVQTNHLSSFSC